MDIKKVIQDSGLSIRKFAASIYVHERTVYNWLAGSKIPKQKVNQINDKYGARKLPTTQGEVDTD